MTSADLTSHDAMSPSTDFTITRSRGGDVFIVAVGFLVALALCWSRVVDIWTTGNFYDSDDAMRVSQVRDFIAGQGWYDLHAWRLDPPNGSFMHWSRVVDAPLALLMRFCAMIVPGEAGERLARILFPLLLQLGLLATMAWIGRLLAGSRGVAPAVALTVLSGFMFGQFVPGRVDHHAPQILLLMLMLGAMLAALDPARARIAVLSAVCAALSLSISVENLPFILPMLAMPAAIWIAAGSVAAPLLSWFAVGLLVATPACFALFNAPARWFEPVCDAFSPTHVLAALGAAAACAILAAASRFCPTITKRLALAGAVGAVIGLPLILLLSRCLLDPFAGLDPMARDIWLNNVGEARPALRHFALYPRSLQTIVIPTIIGLTGFGLAIWRESGLIRARYALALSFALLGCAAALFMIRAATSLAPVALLGCVWIAAGISRFLSASGLGQAGTLAATVFATLPMSSIGWAMAPSFIAEPRDVSPDVLSCLSATDYRPLAQLPPALVIAPIDLGAHILAHTSHSVVSAPYHRNNAGNRRVIDILSATPDDARNLVRHTGAKYLVSCAGAKELNVIAAREPASLAARLLRAEPPDWLRQAGQPDARLVVYRLD